MSKLFGGCRFIDAPSPHNVARIDHGALPLIQKFHKFGIRVDLPLLRTLQAEFTQRQNEIEWGIFESIGHSYQDFDGKKYNPFNISSPDQVARLMFDHLKVQGTDRLKLVKSEKRPECTDKTLEKYRDKYPAVGMIGDHRKLDKLLGTYVIPLQILADPYSRVHTSFSVTTATTGRLSSRNPNLQTIPTRTREGRRIRECFLASPNNHLVSCDLCLHPDTSVETVYGPKRMSDIVVGEKVLTLRGNYIKFGEVTRVTNIGYLPSYRLTFDNNESVIASSDHKWPVNIQAGVGKGWHGFTRIEKTTEDLVIGEHMVPCKIGSGGDGRETWYSKGARWYTKKHVLVAEAVYGPRPLGHDVHHKDENFLNNDPSNLEYKLSSKHKSNHSRENYKRQDHTLRVARLREGLKARRPYFGSANPNAKLKDGDWGKILELRLKGCSTAWLAEQYGVGVGHIRNLIRKQKNNNAKLENHQLVKKEFLGFQPMYSITVEPDHNYVLSCGVVTCNSQIEMRWAAHLSQDPTMISIFENDQDIHDRTACEIFGRNLEEITLIKKRVKSGQASTAEELTYKYFAQFERLPSKTIGFGILYGQTAQGLQESILNSKDPDWTQEERVKFEAKWTLAECERIINQWFGVYNQIKNRLELQYQRARRYGMVWGAMGRIRLVPEVYSVHKWIKSEGLRKAGNHEYQDSAQGTIKLAMAELDPISELFDGGGVCWPLLQIHDELITEVDKGQAKDWADVSREVMEMATPLSVPVKSSSDVAERWSDLH
jgi:DNA polymerase I-like protein with 3'-5' exonuclease and polymerase domains